jgi:hypothetical protein
MKFKLFCLSIAACLPLAECRAQVNVSACPALMMQAPPVAPSDTPWVSMIYKGYGESRPESIMVFDGHPAEMASLQPDQSKQTNGEITSIWHLDHPEPGRGFWLACTYTNSSGIFAIPLAPTIRQCRLKQRVLPSGRIAEMMSFSCF